MYFEFGDCYYGSTASHEDEKSRYFRRSDALLSELQASFLSPDNADDEPEPTTSFGVVAPHHPQSSPPAPRTLLRPFPQRPAFMPVPTEGVRESSTMEEEDPDSDSCDALRPSPSSLEQWIEELRSEGARNPLREDRNVVLSESTQLFLKKNNACLLDSSSSTTPGAASTIRATSTATPSRLALFKPVALRAADVTHSNMM